MKVMFAIAFWGEEYARSFLDLGLPTQLSPRNIGHLSIADGAKYLIVTTAADAKIIRESPLYGTLCRHVEVEFVTIVVSRPSAQPGYILNQLLVLIARRSEGYDALFFLFPDHILADGFIENSLRRLAEGYACVAVPVPRVDDEGFVSAFHSETDSPETRKTGIKTISCRRLVKLATPRLHLTYRYHFWHSPDFTPYPSTFVWQAPNDGLLIRSFHRHPVAVRVQSDNRAFYSSFERPIDEEYVPQLLWDVEDVYCAVDSDEIAACSPTPVSHVYTTVPLSQRSTTYLARWAEYSTALAQRDIVRHNYRWHHDDIDPSEWAPVETEAERCVDSIIARLNTPDSVLAAQDREAYRARMMLVQRYKNWHKYQIRVPSVIRCATRAQIRALCILRFLSKATRRLRMQRLFNFILGHGQSLVPALRRVIAINDGVAEVPTTTLIAELWHRRRERREEKERARIIKYASSEIGGKGH